MCDSLQIKRVSFYRSKRWDCACSCALLLINRPCPFGFEQMKRRQLFCSRIGTALLFSLPLIGVQMQRSLALPGRLSAQFGLEFTVNSTGDGDDFLPGNGVCETATGNHQCTLRAAIQEANAHAGDDGIVFSLPVPSTINLTSALPDLSTNMSITGPGANLLAVQHGNQVSSYRIFNVTTTGTVTVSGLFIAGGRGVADGAGIRNAGSGTVQVTDCLLVTNTANAGGGISNVSVGTVTVTNCRLNFNSSLASGGGIFNNSNGTVNIINTRIDSGFSDSLTGGGVFNNGGGTVNVTNSTIDHNHAVNGGGLVNFSTGTVNVTNSTITMNSATGTGAGDGGGIYNVGSGTMNVTNSTLSSNSATRTGGGILNISGMVNILSTILANNTASTSGPDVFGNFTSGGFNLIGKNDGAAASFPAGNPNANNDIVGTSTSPKDPKLDPAGLQSNGGPPVAGAPIQEPVLTIALQPGSPAIDKGNNANAARDQRNYVRSGVADIGAFEFAGTIPVTLANISTRLRVETGDNVLIGGFIITGTHPKKIIVRAIGPSLPLAGVLANPVLELHGPPGFTTITNDNWRSDQQAEIIATGIPPTNDLESAIVATLPANNAAYTAIVRGVSNGTGIGLVEAYDLDRTVDSKLANISTRGFVQTGNNVLIGGLIVLGQDQQKVIVRAIGPSLTNAGVPNALQDPTLELRDGNGGLIRSNDNWRTDQQAEIIATTIPPTNDLESAIVATLPANGASYTAIVRGVNGTTGVAVVEVYAIN